jgi:CBS domain-containing protein
VGDVATRDVASVTADASLRECADQLKSRGVRHLPVVRDGQPIGIISARDFFEAAAGEFEKLISSAQYGEQLRRDVDPYDHFGGAYGRCA